MRWTFEVEVSKIVYIVYDAKKRELRKPFQLPGQRSNLKVKSGLRSDSDRDQIIVPLYNLEGTWLDPTTLLLLKPDRYMWSCHGRAVLRSW